MADPAQIDRRQLVAAAYHEAGHAVVAGAVGYHVYQVNTDGEGFGEVR